MIAPVALRRLRAGISAVSAGKDDNLRSVGTRLAAQTIGLLLVMVIALEVVLYVSTDRSLRGTLEQTLRGRAKQVDPTVCGVLELTCPGIVSFHPGPGFGQPAGPGSSGRYPPPGTKTDNFHRDLNPAEASAVFVDWRLTTIHGDGPRGTAILDKVTLREVVRDGRGASYTEATYQNHQFLVYTKPLLSGTRVVGAVQTSVSEFQYLDAKRSILRNLLLVAVLGLLISGGISVVLVRRALDPIRSAMQRQRDFVADAAHELRTPLAIQRTVAEVGLGEGSLESAEATLEQMLVENKHLTRLVDDLSLLARADSNAVAINPAPMSLSSLVADTTSELAVLAEEQGVHLNTDVDSDIGVMGDVMRLRQLLLVLLDNALKYTPSGGTVQVALHARGGRAQLRVRDSGSGIDPSDLPHIFNRFYRADKARTGEGTGLGLAIAQWIVQAHGGQIHAENVPPRGAMFTATLPVLRTSHAA